MSDKLTLFHSYLENLTYHDSKISYTYTKTEINSGIHYYLCRALSEIKNLTSSHGNYMVRISSNGHLKTYLNANLFKCWVIIW